ncbi:MAG: hypothetical protein A2580_09160 [Hydrogenophilales bacterium RIFOXYD1_FULL_62_11]|nr:MAG: hypothetical protein A2580_09160 [Hydrogenophilales bacterium RIFOXYD1_FULL_62_11]
MGSPVHHIHMRRRDPLAPSTWQHWRAWIEPAGESSSRIVMENGKGGDNFDRIEVGADEMAGGDPVSHLASMILAKSEAGWETTLLSDEDRISAPNDQVIFFEIRGGSQADQEMTVAKLLELFAGFAKDQLFDHITPVAYQAFANGKAEKRWTGEFQVGRDRIKLETGTRAKMVLAAEVPVGSIASHALMFVAAGMCLPSTMDITVCDESALGVDAKEWVKKFPASLESLKELAWSTGAIPRPLSKGLWNGAAGVELTPAVF